ncbi:MAG TPA: hypothetical protein VF974_07835 [Patescibacteria group bacterium]
MKKHQTTDTQHIAHAEKWLQDHGKPKYEDLIRLAHSPYIEDKEELQEYAKLYNLELDPDNPDASAAQLWSAMDSSPDTFE